MVGMLLPLVLADQPWSRDGRDRGWPHPTLLSPERGRGHRHHQPRLVLWVLWLHGRKFRNRIRV